jgi:hypothetical protein
MTAQPGHYKTARMNVDRAFKGDLTKNIELFDSGMCDGPVLQVGGQYLMYTTPLASGMVPSRGCTRSRRVEDADEDLAFLKQYSAGNVATRIYGTVRFRPDEPEDSTASRTPLKDARVTLSSDGHQFRATSNSLGVYSLSNLAPGEYTVSADLSGYRLDAAPDGVMLRANGCAVADLLMKVDRRVEGTVLDNDGQPVGGALVEMVSTDQKLERWQRHGGLDITDEDGHYTIDGLPPGEYYLGVNIQSTPSKKHPYATTYYPNTPDPRQAVPIGVPVGASVQMFDLRVPRRLPLVTIRGKVQTADGKPPLPEDHPQIYVETQNGNIRPDAGGQFELELCEGINYSAYASSGPVRSRTYSAHVEFTPTKEHELVLILDKTEEQFLKLRPR